MTEAAHDHDNSFGMLDGVGFCPGCDVRSGRCRREASHEPTRVQTREQALWNGIGVPCGVSVVYCLWAPPFQRAFVLDRFTTTTRSVYAVFYAHVSCVVVVMDQLLAPAKADMCKLSLSNTRGPVVWGSILF